MITKFTTSLFSPLYYYFPSQKDGLTNPPVEETKPVLETPLHNIAEAIASGLKGYSNPIVWRRNDNSRNYRCLPPLAVKHYYHVMSSWKTVCLIEDLMIETQPLSNLRLEDKSTLKKYLINLARDEGSFLTKLWSRIIHGLKGEGWISTAGKATQLLARLKNSDSDYWVGFEEIWGPGNSEDNSGRSRVYDVKKEGYSDLSKQHKGIGFINGIHNSFNDAQEAAAYLGDLAGANISAVYNAKHGLFADLIESWFGWWGYSTKPSRKVQKLWDEFFDHQPSNARFLMFCHSQGALHVKAALAKYPEERRKRIDIVSIAPGVYIDPTMCGSVISYKVKWYRDPIPQIDLKAAWNFAKDKMTPGNSTSTYDVYKKTLVELECDPNGEYIDHAFRSLTYAPAIAKHLLEFVNKKL